MTFEDLKFNSRTLNNKPHPMGEQALAYFPNGYAASIVRGPESYGGSNGLYELAVLKGTDDSAELCYDTYITDDVEGHLSPEEVTDLLIRIAALPDTRK